MATYRRTTDDAMNPTSPITKLINLFPKKDKKSPPTIMRAPRRKEYLLKNMVRASYWKVGHPFAEVNLRVVPSLPW